MINFLPNFVDFVTAPPPKLVAKNSIDPSLYAVLYIGQYIKIFLLNIFAILVEVEGSFCDCNFISISAEAGDEECEKSQNYGKQAADVGQHFVDFS